MGKGMRIGLSPRLRGNPVFLGVVAVHPGSIPAPAGEPAIATESTLILPVYPRACGGTIVLMPHSPSVTGLSRACGGTQPCLTLWTCNAGLSPRLRGNQRLSVVCQIRYGSIPAPAGEPRRHAHHFVKARSIPAPAGEPSLSPGHSFIPQVYPAPAGNLPCGRSSYGQMGLSPRLRGTVPARRTR